MLSLNVVNLVKHVACRPAKNIKVVLQVLYLHWYEKSITI